MRHHYLIKTVKVDGTIANFFTIASAKITAAVVATTALPSHPHLLLHYDITAAANRPPITRADDATATSKLI